MVWRNWGNDDFWFFHLPANDERLLKLFFFFFSSSIGFTISSSSSSQWQKCNQMHYKISNWKVINKWNAISTPLFMFSIYFVFSIQPVKWFHHKTGWHKRTRTFQWIWQGEKYWACLLTRACPPYLHTHTEREMRNHAPCTNNSKCSSACTFRIANCRIYFGRTDRVSAHCTHTHITTEKIILFDVGS